MIRKVNFFIYLFLSVFFLHAQVSPPERISYQGIARNSSGSPLSNQPIWVKISILKGTMNISGRIYEEDHQKTTNQFGLFTLEIGGGNIVNCAGCVSSFSNIAWELDTYYLQVAISADGINYDPVGTQQLLSVPYALYSKRSGFSMASFTTLNAPPGNVTVQSSGIVSVSPPSGSSFTVTAPSPTFMSTDGITNITGVYPNYSVTTTPSLSIVGNNLSISGGNTVAIPAAPAPTINGLGIANVTSTAANVYDIDVPSSTLTSSSATNGVVSLTLNQGTVISSTSFNILPAIQNNAWGLNGNTVTAANYLGTNNAADLILKTNNQERMRITPSGAVGIGTSNPTATLSVNGDVDIPGNKSYKYTSPKTYTLSIHPTEFVPEGPHYSYVFSLGFMTPSQGTQTIVVGTSLDYYAPLILPHNATITAIYAYVIDNNTSHDITKVQLYKNSYPIGSPFANQSFFGPNLSTTGSNSNIQLIGSTFSPNYTPEVVDNSTSAYFIIATIPYVGAPSPSSLYLGRIMVIYQKLETD